MNEKNKFYIENHIFPPCIKTSTRKGAQFFIDIAHYKSLNKIINFLEKIYFKKKLPVLNYGHQRERKSITIIHQQSKRFQHFRAFNHQLFSNLNEEEYIHIHTHIYTATHSRTVKM